MGLALIREDFDALYEAPPATDWTAALAAVDSMKDFQQIIDGFETETSRWLAQMRANLNDGPDRLFEKAAGLPKSEVRALLLPLFDEMIASAEDALSAHQRPFHEEPDAGPTFEKLKRVSGGAGRYLRKQINRIEDVRVKRYNGLVDIYYALLALRHEIESDGEMGKVFSDPSALGDFLRKQVA
ncbi:MAG: hypothetical protein MEQ84_08460 [Mesorhizobium sp.]|nr:hypothetical protein [Mesorhizobium sp.]